jgi:hypothetical protein
MNGWIKLHRQFLDWEWYDDHNTSRLFLHMLLKANHEDKKWRGQIIHAGSFIGSLGGLSEQTGISLQSVRTSLDRLKSTHQVTCKTTCRHTLFTLVKWRMFQDCDPFTNTPTNTPTNTQVTSKQHAANMQVTTTKELKNNKNERSNPPIIPPKGGKCGTSIPDKSYFDMSLAKKYNMNPDIAFEIFEDWAVSNGKTYEDWSRTWKTACCEWLPEKYARRIANQQIQNTEIKSTPVEPINWHSFAIKQYPQLRDKLETEYKQWDDLPQSIQEAITEDIKQ